jgi:imidazolonepropionase-like amidohydrolase
MRIPLALAGLVVAVVSPSRAQRPTLSAETMKYLRVDAPVVALTHVRVIDGTGAPPRADQTVVVSNGSIAWVGPAGSAAIPDGATVLDLAGKTVIPGLVGLHDHSFYTTAGRVVQSSYTSPLLYLAAGVTTIRTTGANSPYAEINLKRSIDGGAFPGPHMFITGPYLTGPGSGRGSTMVEISSDEEARRVVAYWADEGVQWIKFYTTISRAAMKAAIDEGHRRGIKFTGHLCSVSYREAVALGIDGLEHGLFANADYDRTRTPDRCSPNLIPSLMGLDLASEPVQATFRDLISHGVTLTSTLAVIELYLPGRPPLDQRVLDALSPEAREEYLAARAALAAKPESGLPLTLFDTGRRYEQAFVKAGGNLAAGVDPTGSGGALFGFGDQRNLELLVEGGFSVVEAIRIATANGARALGILDRTGTVEAGKVADLVVIDGNPVDRIADIRKVELVLKDGWGFDSPALIAAAKGQVGIR